MQILDLLKDPNKELKLQKERIFNHFVIGSLGPGRGYNGAFDTREYIFVVKNHKIIGKTTRNYYQFMSGKPYSSRIVNINWGAHTQTS